MQNINLYIFVFVTSHPLWHHDMPPEKDIFNSNEQLLFWILFSLCGQQADTLC